jgi:hypothetical protein
MEQLHCAGPEQYDGKDQERQKQDTREDLRSVRKDFILQRIGFMYGTLEQVLFERLVYHSGNGLRRICRRTFLFLIGQVVRQVIRICCFGCFPDRPYRGIGRSGLFCFRLDFGEMNSADCAKGVFFFEFVTAANERMNIDFLLKM